MQLWIRIPAAELHAVIYIYINSDLSPHLHGAGVRPYI